jgi:hypothetical protein
MGEKGGMHRVLVGEPEGDPGLDGNNSKMDQFEVGCGGVDWIELAQNRERWKGTCECGNEPLGFIKCGEFLD